MKYESSKKPTDLCDGCKNVIKTSGYGRELKFCSKNGSSHRQIDFPVETCSIYEMRGSIPLWEMEEMATFIEKRKDAPGFRFFKRSDGNEREII